MTLRAVCIKVAIECVDGYLNCGPTSPIMVELNTLVPNYKRSSEYESDYMQQDTWNNKGKDLLNETLAEFGFQIKCIDFSMHGMSITTELMKEEA